MSKMDGSCSEGKAWISNLSILGCASLISLISTSLYAGNSNPGLFLSADAGVNLADELRVPSFMGEDAPVIDLNPGFRCDLASGYEFKLSDQFTLTPQATAGVLYNTFCYYSTSGYYLQVPLLANCVLKFEFKPGWRVYAGGGVGGDYCYLNTHVIVGEGGGYGLGRNTDGEWDVAWQGIAGIQYQFGSSEVGLGYKYLGVRPFGWQTAGNHAIVASYTFHF